MNRCIALGLAGLVLVFSRPVAAAADEAAGLEVIRPGDTALSCGQIAGEIALMEDVVFRSRDIEKRSHYTSAGVGVAKTAVGFLIGSLPGALGVMAAGHIVSEATDDRGESAAALQDAAAQRRSMMIGIFNAKGCEGPIYMSLEDLEPAAGEETPPPAPVRPRYNE